jgi:predicted secreted protein
MGLSRSVVRNGVLAAAAAAAVLASQVATGLADPTSTRATVPTYTHRDSGRTLHLHVGDRLRIRLLTVTDGDFFWHFVRRPDPAVVRVVRKRIVAPKLAPGQVGGAAHTIYRLRAVGEGRTRIRLVYYQGTMRQQVAKRFTLRFRVR